MRRFESMRFVVALVLALLPARAFAFVCSKACANQPCPMLTQVWQTRCIPFAVNPNSDLLAGEARHRLVAQSFDVWSSKGNPCTDLTFKDEGDTDQLEHFAANELPSLQRNTIAAIEDREKLGDIFNDTRLLAVTLTHFSVGTGEILDADIMINAVNFRFDEVTDRLACMIQPATFDLRNTLVHEIGHFIGFDHTNVEAATMFASAEPCEINKRDLDGDDTNGICTVYPSGSPARTCEPAADYDTSGAIDAAPYRNACNRDTQDQDTEGGCSCMSARPQPGSIGILVALLALFVIGRSSAGLRLAARAGQLRAAPSLAIGRRTSGLLRRS